MKPRTFTKGQISTLMFRHSYQGSDGSQKENAGSIVIIQADPDGYCRCREATGKGLANPLTLWSGCLTPDRKMREEHAELAEQLRTQGLH